MNTSLKGQVAWITGGGRWSLAFAAVVPLRRE